MDLGRWENNKLQTVLGSLKDKNKKLERFDVWILFNYKGWVIKMEKSLYTKEIDNKNFYLPYSCLFSQTIKYI